MATIAWRDDRYRVPVDTGWVTFVRWDVEDPAPDYPYVSEIMSASGARVTLGDQMGDALLHEPPNQGEPIILDVRP